MSVRPYPWDLLPRASRRGAKALRQLRGLAEPASVPSRVVAALAQMLDRPITCSLTSVGAGLDATHASHTISVRVSEPSPGSHVPPVWIVLEAELTLALSLIAIATRRPVPSALRANVVAPSTAGAFGALVAGACRRAGLPVVVDVLTSGVVPGGVPSEYLAAGFDVTVVGQTAHLRAFFPRSLVTAARVPFQRSALEDLGDIPLAIPIVACRVLSTPHELASLAPRDVWLLGDAWRLGAAREKPRGPVWLAVAAAESGVHAEIEATGQIVLREGVEELGWSAGNDVVSDGDALIEAVGEVPVVVRVEIGAARMRAREWSALRPGDVIGVGASIGDLVTLRVSGLAVAEGELVDLEGEVGVRIKRRLVTSAK